MTSPAIEELYREGGHSCHACGNVVVVYSVDEPDAAYMERNAIAMGRFAAKHPAGLGALVVIPDTAKPPSEETRRTLRTGYAGMKDYMRGAVLVFEGEGFAASAKRSAFTLLSLTAPMPFPIKVAGTVAEGAVKLVKLLGPALDPQLNSQLIVAAATEVRRSALP